MAMHRVTITRDPGWKEAYEIEWHTICRRFLNKLVPHYSQLVCGPGADFYDYSGLPLEPGQSVECGVIPMEVIERVRLVFERDVCGSKSCTNPNCREKQDLLAQLGEGDTPDLLAAEGK